METDSAHENFYGYMQECKLYEEKFILRNASIDVNDSDLNCRKPYVCVAASNQRGMD